MKKSKPLHCKDFKLLIEKAIKELKTAKIVLLFLIFRSSTLAFTDFLRPIFLKDCRPIIVCRPVIKILKQIILRK